MTKSKYVKPIDNSEDAYARLKPITDAAQAGALEPWSPSVIDLLARYKVNVQRLEDVKAQANLSFPTSIKDHRSMAIGFRYAKDDGSFAEDLFVFVEDVGLTCYYRGTQEEALPEYSGTHHAKIVLSELLPDFQRELANMQQQIDTLKTQSGVEYISDEMHLLAMQAVQQEFNEKVRGFANAHGNSSAVQQFSRAVQIEATKKRRELQVKKAQSDRVYKANMPEVSLVISAQASKGQFDVKLANNSGQALIAETLDINGTTTDLKQQQFNKLYPIENVNAPDGIFDNPVSDIKVKVTYRTLGGLRYQLAQSGVQQPTATERYNVLFPDAVSIQPIF